MTENRLVNKCKNILLVSLSKRATLAVNIEEDSGINEVGICKNEIKKIFL
jgi:hypothetical protein